MFAIRVAVPTVVLLVEGNAFGPGGVRFQVRATSCVVRLLAAGVGAPLRRAAAAVERAQSCIHSRGVASRRTYAGVAMLLLILSSSSWM